MGPSWPSRIAVLYLYGKLKFRWKDIHEVNTEDPAPLGGFDHVQATLTSLDLRDEGLGLPH
jgi:hypothetical protein